MKVLKLESGLRGGLCLSEDVEKLEQENAALYVKNEKLELQIDKLKVMIDEGLGWQDIERDL